MLFLITQTHTPELCPKDVGGSKTLYNPKAEGIKLRAMYSAFSQHTIYYIVEADNLKAINKFLNPGLTRCTSAVTPVNEEQVAQ